MGWTIACLMGLLVVYGMYSYNSVFHPVPYEVMTQIVYGGGHRLAWGAALAWLVLACHNGYGGEGSFPFDTLFNVTACVSVCVGKTE